MIFENIKPCSFVADKRVESQDDRCRCLNEAIDEKFVCPLHLEFYKVL